MVKQRNKFKWIMFFIFSSCQLFEDIKYVYELIKCGRWQNNPPQMLPRVNDAMRPLQKNITATCPYNCPISLSLPENPW